MPARAPVSYTQLAIIGYAEDYISIYLAGTIFVQLALGLNTFISAQGHATVAMLSVLIGAVINIVLDPGFIFVFGMGAVSYTHLDVYKRQVLISVPHGQRDGQHRHQTELDGTHRAVTAAPAMLPAQEQR